MHAGTSGLEAVNSFGVLLFVCVAPVFASIVSWVGHDEYDLYSSWYRPFLVVGGVCYILALVGSVVLVLTPGVRKWGRT